MGQPPKGFQKSKVVTLLGPSEPWRRSRCCDNGSEWNYETGKLEIPGVKP